MKRLPLLLLLCVPAAAWADDPPKPVVPVASIVVPTTQPLVVFADGTVSKVAADWQAVDPADAKLRIEGAALLILDWTPGRTYEIALIAYGDTPPVKLAIRKITAPGSVVPPPPVTPPPVVVVPPAPPGPVVTPPPAGTDPLGLTAATRAILNGATEPWAGIALTFRQTVLADAISKAAATPPASGQPQDLANSIVAAYQAAIPAAVRPSWNALLFTPLKAELAKLTAAGKVRTAADVAEAWREIAEALRETPEDVLHRR